MLRQGNTNQKKHASGNRRSGFTLVEILMVVIILGIASAIIVPQLSTRDDLRVAAAARQVMADLIYAQNAAITKQQQHLIVFDTTTQTYTIKSGSWPGTAVTHPMSLGNYAVTFGPTSPQGFQKITLTSADFGTAATTLGFDPLGTPLRIASDGTATTMTSGSIVVTCGTFPLTISVHAYTGELTVN
jgi:prepilin-type N-terminal cleavage/methylation domain-containing protein